MNKYLLALVSLPKMTPRRIRLLLKNYTPKEAWNSPLYEWIQMGLKEKFVGEVNTARPKLDPDKLLENLEKIGADFIFEDNKEFPSQLKNIPSAPAWLFRHGKCEHKEKKCITIVGPRKISDYGKRVTEEFAEELSKNGYIIVSGLALGVDAISHYSALKMSGETIAVLGCGIDQIYPPQNRELAKRIIDSGGMIYSEYPPGTSPARENFPARNRIVSGLSSAVLVTEAAAKSGSLITAHTALDQGKEVFAVPGSIYTGNSDGTNKLIQSGEAQLVSSAKEIIEALGTDLATFRQTKKLKPANKEEALVYEAILDEPTHIDKIIKATSLPSAKVSAVLSMLEMKGFVLDTGSMYYVKK